VNIDLPHIVWWLQGGLISVAFALPIVVKRQQLTSTSVSGDTAQRTEMESLPFR